MACVDQVRIVTNTYVADGAEVTRVGRSVGQMPMLPNRQLACERVLMYELSRTAR